MRRSLIAILTLLLSATLATAQVSINGQGSVTINGQPVGLLGASATGYTLFGYHAGVVNTSVTLTAYGYGAAQGNTTGVQNTAVGYLAGATWTDAHNNVAIGWKAANVTNSVGIVAVGGQAMQEATGGDYATAVGCYALHSTSGANNTAVGYGAASALTSGASTTAIGHLAGHALTTTSYTTAVGAAALTAAAGIGNTAVGGGAGANIVTGDYSVIVGYRALYGVAGANNTAVGAQAGYSTTGAAGTYLGKMAGYSVTGGGGVYLGYTAGYYETAADKFYVDNAQRASEADGRAKALLYGVFAAAPTNQALTVNGVLSADVGAIGATVTTAVAVRNSAPSTAGATVQQSPAVAWESHSWDSDGAVDDSHVWRAYSVPTTAANTQSSLIFAASKSGAAAVLPLQISEAGTVSALSSLTAPSLYLTTKIYLSSPQGAASEDGYSSELMTIADAATSTSSADLLPAGAVIESVVVRTTTVIPGATTYTVGDATTPARFATGVGAAAGGTAVGLLHRHPTVADAAGPVQAAAAKIVITPDSTPTGATGRVRVVVFWRRFTAPGS